MSTESSNNKPANTKGYRNFLLTTTILTCLLIIMGGVVCTTESGAGCPDWPACYGQLIPPLLVDAIIEYTHRIVAALTTPFIIAATIVGWRKYRSVRLISRSLVVALILTLAVIVFGALAVLRGLPPWAATLDLGSALLVLAFVTVAAVVAHVLHVRPTTEARISFSSPYSKLALWTSISVYVVLVSGVLTADPGSIERCFGWPVFFGFSGLVDVYDWLQLARRIFAVLSGVLVVALIVQTWRTQRGYKGLTRASVWIGVLFLVAALTSVLMPVLGYPVLLLVVYSVSGATMWSVLVALTVLAGLGVNRAGLTEK